ncbi:hypothetical protein D9M71_750560 [compost metagenome]
MNGWVTMACSGKVWIGERIPAFFINCELMPATACTAQPHLMVPRLVFTAVMVPFSMTNS